VLLVVGQVEIWTGVRFGGIGTATHPARLAEAILLAVVTSSLAARRRWPLLVAGAVIAGVIVQVLAVAAEVSLIGGLLPLLVVVYSGAVYALPQWRVVPLGGVLAAQAIFAARIVEERATGEILFGLFVIVGTWLVGDVVRARQHNADRAIGELAKLESERAEWTVRALADERAAIARELHDVIAHGVSVMGVQAAGARVLVDRDHDAAKSAMASIESQARESVAELQRLLGVLREAPDANGREPRPGLRQVEALTAQMRQAGVPVVLDVLGTPRELPAGIDLAAYRVVQEALTNVLKHAGPVLAYVRLDYQTSAIGIDVRDDGPPHPADAVPGHGLIGMRERISLYGGSLDIDQSRSGGFHIAARIPVPPGAT
jgi:signal transduction histidine kinase